MNQYIIIIINNLEIPSRPNVVALLKGIERRETRGTSSWNWNINPFWRNTSVRSRTIISSTAVSSSALGNTNGYWCRIVVFRNVSYVFFSSLACWSIMKRSSWRRVIIKPRLNCPTICIFKKVSLFKTRSSSEAAKTGSSSIDPSGNWAEQVLGNIRCWEPQRVEDNNVPYHSPNKARTTISLLNNCRDEHRHLFVFRSRQKTFLVALVMPIDLKDGLHQQDHLFLQQQMCRGQ